MTIEITGTAAIRRNFMASHIRMVKVPRCWFFLPLCFARGTNQGGNLRWFLRMFLHRDSRRVAFTDG
jgi:hypothetical protein